MGDATIPMKPCPSCTATGASVFFRVTSTPVTCTSIFDTPQQARAVASGPVDLAVCSRCGLIFNASFDAGRAEIGARYESSQAASMHFTEFARGLADTWITRHSLAGGSVLEIGCGQCDFLRLLLQRGVARGLGLDPLAPTDPQPPLAGLQVQQRQFDASTLDLAADAVVCRHTLEHVQDVHVFLRTLAPWAARDRKRVVLFELPATERLLSERAFWDVYYEHCNYFSADSLAYAFEASGLQVLRCEPAYGDQYLLLEARAADLTDARTLPDVSDLQAHCIEFGRDVAAAVARCDARLAAMAAGAGPVVLWQGAAKTVGFLAALQCGALVHSAVDLNPQRHGRFLPGSGLPVVSPHALLQIRPSQVVLMNPVYRSEVQALLRQLGVTASLTTVVDLCSP